MIVVLYIVIASRFSQAAHSNTTNDILEDLVLQPPTSCLIDSFLSVFPFCLFGVECPGGCASILVTGLETFVSWIDGEADVR